MTVALPEKLAFLFEPARYKVLYGGRGASKSWGIARSLLAIGASKPMRIFCGREIQKSIKESVHQLLEDQIKTMGLSDLYEVLQSEIRGKNGTQFFFGGLRHNIDNIKSLESVDIAWIEEAQSVSKSSWSKLSPTIRKDGSEIWISFNPELEDDETYQRFVVNPPTGAVVAKINWCDNPWFPDVLQQEMRDLKSRDYDAYLNIWEGHCRVALEGAIYADELRLATQQERITKVAHIPAKSVVAVFDLGYADATAIWFVQCIGHEFRFIDYYENQFKKIQHYTELMQSKGYMYERIVLPHDSEYKTPAIERTIAATVRTAFPNASTIVLPRTSVQAGIDAARLVFPQCSFDKEKCADGLAALRHYKYDVDVDTGKTSKNPLHDWSSHCADAFRYFAMSTRSETKKASNPFASGEGRVSLAI